MAELVVVEAEGRLRRFVVELARRSFGELDAEWVARGLEWDRRWARTLVLLVDGKPVGFNQVYAWPCCGVTLGVHHYAAVVPEARGRGYGKLLIASGEEVLEEMGADVFAATLSSRNRASRSMLEALGYHVLGWSEVGEATCESIVEELLYVTGGYGDDLVALKTAGCPWRDPLTLLGARCSRS